ncbi:MAG: hypothetical protein M3355_08715 [Actinomycetota bacterium]|nr:hypothetical protein [Actinomycetota bacterium]
MNAQALRRAMPGLGATRARALVPYLNLAMAEFGITNQRRAHAFLAQLGHESVSLRYFEEIASGAAYEGRRDLGNVRRGDGRRYKGRGPIQLTGRANYRRYGRILGLPLEAHPSIAGTARVGFRVAGAFWQTHGLNELAERGQFDKITRRINGGTNGAADRRARWSRVKRLGAAVLPGDADPLRPLPRHERRMADRLLYHRREMRRQAATGKGPKYKAHRKHAESWKKSIEQQVVELRASARRNGAPPGAKATHPAWRKDNRIGRTRVLRRVLDDRDGRL